ncbi:hypothetical protein ILUMI_04687 [Ignelater luminosus]|uniref:Mutator-like transposase domain-containing protein n=1 Tax=Ignelater luminosus TaxID=2038154 RepID=A0A8K0DC22_IGNLU|nr:hypothetical protein ILUMI_04687 [Ignelater luminosus]
MMAVLNIPFMARKSYQRCHESVAEVIFKSALKTIEEAGKEEAALVIASGDVDEGGVPLLTVVTDGAWCKRSYNVNYDAASGVSAAKEYCSTRHGLRPCRHKLQDMSDMGAKELIQEPVELRYLTSGLFVKCDNRRRVKIL